MGGESEDLPRDFVVWREGFVHVGRLPKRQDAPTKIEMNFGIRGSEDHEEIHGGVQIGIVFKKRHSILLRPRAATGALCASCASQGKTAGGERAAQRLEKKVGVVVFEIEIHEADPAVGWWYFSRPE